jgi:uncharacterized protein (DUF2147 family)
MMPTLPALVGLGFASLAAFPALAAPGTADDPRGPWLVQSGEAAVRIQDCPQGLCGTIVWLRQERGPAGERLHDLHNADPALRGRPICGMTMLYNFKPDGEGGWSGGQIYDPEHGKTYTARMRLAGNGLALRGYVGVPLFGETQTWTRPPAPLPACRPG